MKRFVGKTIIALTCGMGLALALLWVLSSTKLLATYATALPLDTAGEAQPPRLQAGAVLTVCPAAVGTCPYTNVQAAVDAAHDGDVIKVASGTYTGVQRRPAPPGYAGPSVITQVVYVSKTVAVRGGYTTTNWTTPDAEANPTTLDALGDGRVLFVAGDITPTIEGLRITGGDADGLGGYVVNESPFDGGGGVYIITATAVISGNDVFGNVAGGGGGGLYVEESSVTFNGNTIVANKASRGGGLYVAFSDATFTNDVVADNRANLEGSGAYVFASSARLLHATIARNDGSGIHVSDSSHLDAFSDVALTNTILVSHTVGIVVMAENTATLEATLWGTGTWANTTDWSGGGAIFTGTTHIRGNPAFVAPDAGDYHIGLASAAVDRGVDAGVDDDIDGDPRPLGNGYDVGADETGLIVTKQATPNPMQPGGRLTYTIRITNTSDVPLTATITDTLPLAVTLAETSGETLMLPGGTPGTTWTVGITWTAIITPIRMGTGNGVWTEQVIVTAAMGYVGPLSNVVDVTTDKGATGTAFCISTVNASVYLPLVTRRWPPTPYRPTLHPIDNADGDGGYVVSWTEEPSRLSITYTLQEAGNAAFTTGLREVCATTQQSCTVSGNLLGTYYYHVRGQNAWGYGAWSNVQAVVVSDTCPTTSTNQYSGGAAYQSDQDDPVRPAYNHADKNLELRAYALNTDSGLQRELVNYGSDDPTQPPQLATLFDSYRVPTLSNFYRVHNWNWAPSPEAGTRGGPITDWAVTALGMQTTPGEILYVPTSGYDIGGGMEVIVLFADEDTVALKYARQDSAGAPGYTVHVDNICTDPNLLALYDQLDDPNGPRYVFPNAWYDLPNLSDGQPVGTARDTEIVVAIVDTGTFMDTRSCNEWWQIRPGYTGTCPAPQLADERRYGPRQ